MSNVFHDVARTVMLGLLASILSAAAVAQTKPVVLSDQALITWAHDTFERSDYIYAAIHIGALIQRNPKILRDNPVEAQQLYEAWVYSVARLQQNAQDSRALPGVKARLESCQNPGATASGLESPPPSRPRVNWQALKN